MRRGGGVQSPAQFSPRASSSKQATAASSLQLISLNIDSFLPSQLCEHKGAVFRRTSRTSRRSSTTSRRSSRKTSPGYKIRKNNLQVVNDLPDAIEKLGKIYENEDLTPSQVRDKVTTFLRYLFDLFRPKKH